MRGPPEACPTSKPGGDSDWLVEVDAPAGLPALVLIPHAGTGALAYRRLALSLRTVARPAVVRLPGRETRLSEPGFVEIRPLVRSLVRAVLPRLGPRFVLYGHSMGALVAFETARLLHLAYGIDAEHLVVSGMGAPRDRTRRLARHRLPDDALWETVCDIGGIPPEVAAAPAMRQLLLPTLRADFQVTDEYTYRPAPSLPCPVSAYAGRTDHEVLPDEMLGWGKETRGKFRHTVLPGDHFFNLDETSGFPSALCRLMTEVASLEQPAAA
jgi:medium-chain acyl-[acyl-carrier-protein] hydrolase